MAKKQFKAESKRLLDLMINSIYTNQEIFLRELISNASDAEDKLYFQTLQGDVSGLSRSDFDIWIEPDKENRTLTIRDNGIGMDKDELDKNLGTIAKSGSQAFKDQFAAKDKADEKNAESSGEDKKDEETEDAAAPEKDIDIIGQFGVGFYSAFMVAKKVVVESKKYGADQAHRWTSSGADGYTITECDKADHGTTITMYLKDDDDEHNYSMYLEQYELQNLVTKYSDYIRYPIKMMVTERKPKEKPEGEEADSKDENKEPEYEEIQTEKTLNTMAPIWKKQKSEVSDEEYNEFYKNNFYDYTDPLTVIRSSAEGAATYTALLFIPGRTPVNYYSRDFKKGLRLYASGVLIMENCEQLLPDYFSFVRGLVDSEDLNLNISREMLQQDRQLQVIEQHLEKRIKTELIKMLRTDREKYEKFWEQFGTQIKYGIYSDYGMHKDILQDLLMFRSSNEGKYTTLEEYCDRMKEDQKYIYYACGDTPESIGKLPQTEKLLSQGYEILYFTNEVDEFAIKMLQSYNEKQFRSVNGGDDLGIDTEEEKEKRKNIDEENKELFDFMKDSLDGKVIRVKASTILQSHPVCFTSEGYITLEMEKAMMNQQDPENRVHAQKVLELNTDHPMFQKIKELYDSGDKDKVKTYTKLLYGQAELMEGLPLEDPVAFSNDICALM